MIPEMLVEKRWDRRRDHLLMSRSVYKKKKYADDAFSFLSIQLSPSPILAWRKKKNRFMCIRVNFAQKDDLDLRGDRFTLIID